MSRAQLALACLLGVTFVAAPSQAQRGTLSRFGASETPEDDFHLSRPTDLGDLRYAAQLHLDYGLDPLVYESTLGDPSTESLSVVGHQLTGTLGLSLGLIDRVVVFAGLPVAFVHDGASPDDLQPGVPAADGAGLGDIYLGGRFRILGEDDEMGALAVQATLTLPTSVDSTYRGDPSVTFHPEILGELRPIGELRIVMNLGARIREETSSPDNNLQFRHELTYALGAALPVWTDPADPRTHLDTHVQIYGASAFALFGRREGTALEATLGVKFFHASGLVAGLAGGPGLNRGFGSPDLRLLLSVGWMLPEELPDTDTDGDGIMDRVDDCPSEPEDMDGFEDENGCPDPDNDGDGIPDDADQCVNEPETANGLEDEDGCPDEIGDTDGDGILDDTDQCVDEAEDADGFADEDGCPDPDNDGDGVMDGADPCPNVAGPIENRGCPDTDRDEDTVVDRLDNCPDEPGTVENHGCQEVQQVVIHEGRLDILDRVYFRTNRAAIQRRSHSLLENVGRVLTSHPEITSVRVEGHTDSRGSRERNVRLSQERAEAVVAFLVEHGVSADRLHARGFGPDRPVVEGASTSAEYAQNRRVEFHIAEDDAAASGVEGTD